jgi:hypothetical protein
VLARCTARLAAAVERDPRFAELAGGLEVQGRTKTLFSTLKKLLRLGNTAAGGRARAQLYDIMGLRAIVAPRSDLPPVRVCVGVGVGCRPAAAALPPCFPVWLLAHLMCSKICTGRCLPAALHTTAPARPRPHPDAPCPAPCLLPGFPAAGGGRRTCGAGLLPSQGGCLLSVGVHRGALQGLHCSPQVKRLPEPAQRRAVSVGALCLCSCAWRQAGQLPRGWFMFVRCPPHGGRLPDHQQQQQLRHHLC